MTKTTVRGIPLKLLWFIHRHLLWFVRLTEVTTEHWPTPPKNIEHDVSAAAYERYLACTATLQGSDLERACRGAWQWGKEKVRP